MNRTWLRRLNSFEWLKNNTPHRIALLTAILLGLCSLLLVLLVSFFGQNQMALHLALLIALLEGLTSYMFIYFVLEYFIYRKIKLIYKIIRKQKRSSAESANMIDMNQNVIDDTEEEVREWAAENDRTLADLQKMEAFRREYIGNVSHELKTPIYILQGYLDTLLQGAMDDPSIKTSYLQKAAQNADRLSQIVSDLDFIAQHESGELRLRKEPFVLYNLIREVIDELQSIASSNHITIECKDGSNTSAMVFADREKIRQVLTNLVINSIKYGRENGKTVVSIYDMHRDILVEVSDNGIGIAAQHLPRLFERFYRIDPSRSRQQGGSGLGLAIAKHIIEAHKRKIHVRSQLGVGTTFGFSLKRV